MEESLMVPVPVKLGASQSGLPCGSGGSPYYRAAKFLKEAQATLRQKEGERQLLASRLFYVVGAFKRFHTQTLADVSGLREEFAELQLVHMRALADIRRKFGVEKEVIRRLCVNVEQERKNFRAKLDEKRDRLRHVEAEWTMEMRYGDLLHRERRRVEEKNRRLEQKLNDKLFLGSKSSCDTCKASRSVVDVLENQIVQKASDNRRLTAERDELERKFKQKERICEMLVKETEKQRFELTQTKRESQRQLAKARTDFEQELDLTFRHFADQNKKAADKAPSPPESDEGEFSALWANAEKTPESSVGGSEDRKRPWQPPEPPHEVKDKLRAVLGQCTPIQQPKTEPEEEEGAVEEAIEVDGGVEETRADSEWLRSQLVGHENLTAWYRGRVKALTDDLLYFQERLESDGDALERGAAELEEACGRATDAEGESERLRADIERMKLHKDLLRGTLSNLATSVTTYFTQ